MNVFAIILRNISDPGDIELCLGEDEHIAVHLAKEKFVEWEGDYFVYEGDWQETLRTANTVMDLKVWSVEFAPWIDVDGDFHEVSTKLV